MSAINDGGPAFAAPGMPAYSHDGIPLNPWAGHGWAHDPQPGMSLRAWLAGKALSSMDYGWFGSASRIQEMASESVAIADAMIAALNRKEDA